MTSLCPWQASTGGSILGVTDKDGSLKNTKAVIYSSTVAAESKQRPGRTNVVLRELWQKAC